MANFIRDGIYYENSDMLPGDPGSMYQGGSYGAESLSVAKRRNSSLYCSNTYGAGFFISCLNGNIASTTAVNWAYRLVANGSF